jgi:hypothetical protein
VLHTSILPNRHHPPVELATTGDNRHRIACPGGAVELRPSRRPPYLTSSHGPAVRTRRARPRARVTRKSFRYSASMCLKKTWAKSVVGFDPDAALLGQALGLGWASKPATRRVEISLLFRNAFPSCAHADRKEDGFKKREERGRQRRRWVQFRSAWKSAAACPDVGKREQKEPDRRGHRCRRARVGRWLGLLSLLPTLFCPFNLPPWSLSCLVNLNSFAFGPDFFCLIRLTLFQVRSSARLLHSYSSPTTARLCL